MLCRPSMVACLAVLGMALGCGGGGSSSRGAPPPVNQPPTLNPIGTPQVVQEGVLFSLSVSAMDPEGDALTLTATPVPPTANWTDMGNGTGSFTFTPTPAQVGTTITVTFGADDGTNPVVTEDVDFVVIPAPNLPPVLAPIPTPQSVDPLATLAFTVTATDPDLDPITLGANSVPPNATFNDNSNGTGDFSFTPGVTQGGISYTVEFVASDSINSPVNQFVQIDVVNQPPTLDPIPTPRTAPVGSTHSFIVTASDPELDPVSLTATPQPLPSGATFVDLGNGTGDFTWLPITAQQNQRFTITFGVDDGSNPTVTQDVDIDVVAPNLPPTLNPIPTPQAIVEGRLLAFQVSATDPELDPITLTATPQPLPSGANFVDLGNGTGDFTFTPDATQAGTTVTITFAADDGANTPATQPVDIDVLPIFTEVTPPLDFGATGWGLASGDFDGDGIVDLAAVDGDIGSAGLVVMLGNDGGAGQGNGTFTVTLESPYALPGAVDPIPRHLAVADFNNDLASDAAVLARLEADLHVFLCDTPGGIPDGTLTAYAPGFIDFPVADDVFHVAAADMDSDNKMDLVTGGAAPGGSLRILVGNGLGGFIESPQSPIMTSATLGDPVHVAVADFNEDGIPDIAAVNLADAAIYLYMGDNDGTGRNGFNTFTQGPTISDPLLTSSQPSVADFNRDLHLDIAVPHFDAAAAFFTIWLGDGSGGFVEGPVRPAIGVLAEYSATGDFNGDGNPDLAASNAGGNPLLHVLYGDGAGGFTPGGGSPFALSGAGRSVVVDDFTNDGLADIAVATQGDTVSGLPARVHVFLGQ